mgnify:CR=1 FL=1
MKRRGKKYLEAFKKTDRQKRYTLEDAIELVQEAKYAKFDETMDIAVRLGVNPRHADQMVRGSVVVPHGLGRAVSVLVFAKEKKQKRPKMRALIMSAQRI